jgi:hypothetical protein
VPGYQGGIFDPAFGRMIIEYCFFFSSAKPALCGFFSVSSVGSSEPQVSGRETIF